MAVVADVPQSWSDVDLEHALPSDPRPWSALLSALAERCAAACVKFPSELHGMIAPDAYACYVVRSKIRALASESFVTLDHPRANGIGWNYDADCWSTFPRNVWPSIGYVDDAIYPVGPAVVLAGHPMVPPAPHAPEKDLDASVYRAFLLDCAYWLDKCRYVDASDYAETRRQHYNSPYPEYGMDTYAESLAALVAGTQPVDERGCSSISALYRWNNSAAYQPVWFATSSGYELYAVNRSALPSVALLLFSFHIGGYHRDYPFRQIRELSVSNTFLDYLGGVYAKDNVERAIQSYLHGSSWCDSDLDVRTISGAVPHVDNQGRVDGADFTNCVYAQHLESRRWDEPGSRYVVLSSSDRSGRSTTSGSSSKYAFYNLFDSFGFCGAPGLSGHSVDVPGHGRELLADLTSTPAPTVDVSAFLPSGADDLEAEIRVSCHQNVVLDYHDAYKFKLAEEESE